MTAQFVSSALPGLDFSSTANDVLALLSTEKVEQQYALFTSLEWLDHYMASMPSQSTSVFAAARTPANRQHARTPMFKRQYPAKTPKTIRQPLSEAPVIPVPVDIPELEMLDALQEPVIDNDITPKAPSPILSPTHESEISSPSTSTQATPAQVTRKGSFSFAPLPARDPLQQSLGGGNTAELITEHITDNGIERDTLGLDSELSEDESVDLRAPELIAHDERMKAYASSPFVAKTQEPEYPEIDDLDMDGPVEPAVEIAVVPTSDSEDEDMDDSEPNFEVFPSSEPAEPIQSISEGITQALEPQKPQQAKRAPKTAIGRPVRPTLAGKPKISAPVPIKIKSLSKPINTAPVAAHNQDVPRNELKKKPSTISMAQNQDAPRNELKKKPSTTFTTPAPSIINKPTKSNPPSNVFAIAQKKKAEDEAAVEQNSAVYRGGQEGNSNTRDSIVNKERAEREELERKARECSEERRRKHVAEVEAAKRFREAAERRQEREEAAAAEEKQKKKQKILDREIKPVAKPINKAALKCAVKPSLKNPPKIKPALVKTKTGPTRPPARLENHDSRPVSRFESREPEEKEELPPQSTLSKPPVRASSLKKPSIFTSTAPLSNFPQPPRTGPSMAQFATQKIPFAAEPTLAQHNMNAGPSAGPSRPQTRPGINTPYTQMHSMHTIQTITADTPSEATLPEIHTDSSDDSQDAKSLASWATPGHLTAQLSFQESVNTDAVFPPIPHLSMEDIFRNNPRVQKLNHRSSSANWNRSGDALTEAEISRDRIARNAIKTAGGWTYGVADKQ